MLNYPTIKLVTNTTNGVPVYATPGSAGCDLQAELSLVNTKFLFNATPIYNLENTIATVVLHPGGRALIPTGLHMSLPSGYEAHVRPRSGLALKHGITVLNTPGTIDADYTGDIGIILINHSTEDFQINQGDRIAQLVVTPYQQAYFLPVDKLTETERGDGGFGHTGK
jgi:dUTP pyrophosphatase